MLGAIAILLSTVGLLSLYFLRIGVLSPFSWPQYLVAALAVALATGQLRRPSGRAARFAAWAAIVGAVAYCSVLEFATRYAADRPEGPAIGVSVASLALRDSTTGEPLSLVRDDASDSTLLVCFRGFW